MSSSSAKSSSSSSGGLSKRPIDPITRTALRYTISPREYELLHQYIISRAPALVQNQTPNPPRYEKITKGSTEGGDYNVAAMRAALRVYVTLFLGLKGWETLMQKLANRKHGATLKPPPTAHKYPNVRIAGSFASILLAHRVLHRFFRRLRGSLLEESAEPFRTRNPTITKALTSHLTPAIGASLAGTLLAVSPSDQFRITVAIYLFSRSLEFSYNALDAGGYLWSKEKGRPWWFGSWMILPFTCGQLLHAFVYDRDCFPASYGKFILARSPEYIQMRPKDLPEANPWPSTFDIVDAVAELGKLQWPPFVSPILFPGIKDTLPSSPAVRKVAPISNSAHPAIKHASCAVLHPHDPSCARTYLKYWISAFPIVARFFTLLYGAFALLGIKSLIKDPLPFLNRVSQRILRLSVFITGAIGTSWMSICLFNKVLPRSVLATQRWFLGGFIGGLWAYVARSRERSNFLYSARVSIDSLYKVGKKRGWWRGLRNGDVLLFVTSLAMINLAYETQPTSISGAALRKGLSSLNGQGWVDKAKSSSEDEGKKSEGSVEKESEQKDE